MVKYIQFNKCDIAHRMKDKNYAIISIDAGKKSTWQNTYNKNP